VGGSGSHADPGNLAILSASAADASALFAAIDSAKIDRYPNPPQTGLNQTSVENSRSIGESFPSTDSAGTTSMHKIDDINVVSTKDGTTWGYVYHTSDGRLFVQQDQNSRGQGSFGIPLPGGASIGYTPAPATHPEPLMQPSQLPPQCRVEPSPILASDGKPYSKQLVPEVPHQHLHNALMKRDGEDRSDINNWGVTSFDPNATKTVGQLLGNPQAGDYLRVTPAGPVSLSAPGQQQTLGR
jgi:hypothetical protein